MKIKFLFIIILLSFLISCQKERTATNSLSGKIKTVTEYDSLNRLVNSTHYLYDDTNGLYCMKSNLDNRVFTKVLDTIILQITLYDTITHDSTIHYLFGYLNNQNKIISVEISDYRYASKISYCQFQTSTNNILQEVIYNTDFVPFKKVYSINYDGANYLQYNVKSQFSIIPPNLIIDTTVYDLSYSNLPLNTGILYYFNFLDLTPFAPFGYFAGKQNTNMPLSIYDSYRLTNFTYTVNTNNYIYNIKQYKIGRLTKYFNIEYY